jgi:hypothetical protein
MIRIKSQISNQVFVLFNIWMAFIVLSKFVLIFPHWKISVIALINYDLYFLVTLLALAVFFKDRHNKFIFLNIAIFSLSYVLGFLTIFLGEDYSFGNHYFQYYFWAYRKIFTSIITCITIIYVTIDYLYHEKRIGVKYLKTLFITIPISLLYYKNFFLDYRYLFQGDNYYQIFSGILGLNFLALFFIVLYGYLLFKFDKPISGHVNLIVFGFLIFLAIDSVDNFFNYLRKPLPDLSQVFLIGNLILFVSILIHNIVYLNTEFGKFYEDFRFSKIKLNIKLLKRKTIIDRWIILLQGNFMYSPFRMFLLFLMVISLSFFLYFYPYGYTKLSFLILIFIMIILLFYLNFLVRKRTRLEITNKK